MKENKRSGFGLSVHMIRVNVRAFRLIEKEEKIKHIYPVKYNELSEKTGRKI